MSAEARNEELAIDIRDLGIRYNLSLTRRTTLKGSQGTILRRHIEGSTHFWALRHLSFTLKHGEALGVIGPNGAGKSTLLLTLAGILVPSEGSVDVRGQLSTLLTLGAGFEPELSGRDNIDLLGAFLGVGRRERQDLAPQIIEFADIGAFIDAPVKTYSLGMKSRLGFSIATSVQPDILLLDEVLGTGDQVFRAKSQQRIRELMVKAKAIVIVTHDLTYVTESCNRGMLLEQGQLVFDGDPDESVALYKERVAKSRLLAASDTRRFSVDGAHG